MRSEPGHTISYSIDSAPSESDQFVRLRSLIRAFTWHFVGSEGPRRLQAPSEDSDQAVWIPAHVEFCDISCNNLMIQLLISLRLHNPHKRKSTDRKADFRSVFYSRLESKLSVVFLQFSQKYD